MRATTLLPALVLAALCAACAHAPAAASGGAAVYLHGHRIQVEIAADDASRAHGLMDRASMPEDHGMLFVFPDAQIRTFWMKDTLIPLDMLFLNADGKLVTLTADATPCKADPCAIYPSTRPARYVLELNAGVAAKLGLRGGDAVTFVNLPPGSQ
jgi:uncharacterized protein